MRHKKIPVYARNDIPECRRGTDGRRTMCMSFRPASLGSDNGSHRDYASAKCPGHKDF